MNFRSFKSYILVSIAITLFALSFKAKASLSLQTSSTSSELSPLYLSEIEGNASQLIELGTLTTLGTAYGFAIQGNYAYITTGNQGNLKIVDISNPTNPQVISQWQCQGIWICDAGGLSIWQVEVSGNYAFVRGGANLYVIDISNPTSPQLANYQFLDNGAAYPFTKQGNYIYTEASEFDGSRRLDVFDISDPFNLDRTIWTELDYSIVDLVVQGDYMYVVADGIPGQLIIYDISQGSPVQVSQRTLNGLTYGIAIIDNYLYVGDISVVHVIDVATPTNPIIRGQIGNNQVGFVVDLHIENNVLYVNQKYPSGGSAWPGIVAAAHTSHSDE